MQTAEDIVRMKNSAIISVSPQATIAEALQTMVAHKIGAILIMDAGLIAGIWTERDLMRNIQQEGFDLQRAPIGDYMIKDVKFAAHDETVYELMDKFLGLRLRHLPVEKGGGLYRPALGRRRAKSQPQRKNGRARETARHGQLGLLRRMALGQRGCSSLSKEHKKCAGQPV